jgi:hypothetical protein
MEATQPQPAGPPQWTPGAGWERIKREMPHLVPELTDEDMRKADELIAAHGAGRGEGQQAA